jgi:hypothetical protein
VCDDRVKVIMILIGITREEEKKKEADSFDGAQNACAFSIC